MLTDFWQDLRYAARLLAKRPGFTAIIVATLALGIGANTAIFSIVDAVLLRPLPYKDADRLMLILSGEVGRTGPAKLFDSYSDFQTWQKNNQSFEQMEAYSWARAGQTLVWQGSAQRVLGVSVSAGFFSLLGAQAAQGRTFEPEDINNGCAVVLSHAFWQQRLGGATDIVGSSLTLEGQACTVVGIMPEGFEVYPKQTDMWLLITADGPFARDPLSSLVVVLGRLKPGINKATARAELAALHQQTVAAAPPASWLAQVEPSVSLLQEEFTWLAGRNLRTSLMVLLAAVGLVLLIACINVANLLLGRGAERQKELAIRAALGSTRARLIRQLMSESLLLALVGAVPGALIAVVGVHYFRVANPVELPPGNPVTVNLRVLGFAVCLAMLASLVFGLLPARHAARIDLNEALKSSGRATRGALAHRFGKLLVIAEVTLSILLMTGASLLIASVLRLRAADLGFRADHLLTAQINLPAGDYRSADQRFAFYDRLQAALIALPEVQGVALGASLPLYGFGNSALNIAGKPAPPSGGIGDVGTEAVNADYFNVMEIPFLAGRPFDSRDRADTQPVALINEALAREYFAGENPIGRQIKVGKADDPSPWLTIIGVVGDLKRTTVFKEMDYVDVPYVYRPVSQAAGNALTMMIRVAGSPAGPGNSLARVVSAFDSRVPVSDISTMDEKLATFLAYPRFRAALLGVFAALALALAMVGIYGVLAQAVTQRTQELGIRVALGAPPRTILAMVIRQGMLLVLIGVASGLAAAFALTRLMMSLLYHVSPTDPWMLAANTLLLVAAALLACYLPARRATKVDPMVALRAE
ncbi:MAG TPA: ABC transporter permease [Blastocatellia bacterium]|nr:ABC transporter permease [Blastocatellia bacterium]